MRESGQEEVYVSCVLFCSPTPSFFSLADPPAVEPTFLEIRQGQGRSVTMSCRVLRAYPTRVLTFEWRLGSKLLRTGRFDAQDSTEYIIRSLSRDSYGNYSCNIINEAGAGRCSFLVTALAPRMQCTLPPPAHARATSPPHPLTCTADVHASQLIFSPFETGSL
ncbi:MAM domain-containing glycosylphosphatidylinositol anchor protein 2, partial [Ophiophagus hannah]